MSSCDDLLSPSCATLKGWLVDAHAARRELLLGKKAQTVIYGDMQTTYTPADITALNAYITELTAKVDATCGTCYSAPRRRAIQFVPG